MNEHVVLLVGAGTALGHDLARQLAAQGWRVALNDLLPTRVQPLAEEIIAGGGQAAADAADLTRKLALQTMLQGVLERWGRVDALVFIPSVQPEGNLLDLDEWDWHRGVDATLTAGFLITQSVGRVMRELGNGVVVYAGVEGNGSPVFAAANAGLQALALAAAAELAAHNIRLVWQPDASAQSLLAALA
ncbi:MAG: SDR family NAD(P)-dependent oxidoreductase [Anaerolineales bacterium]|nr:SDR family NAD(P)-dependent oxidoreductase [Anaerolineales bacterium]